MCNLYAYIFVYFYFFMSFTKFLPSMCVADCIGCVDGVVANGYSSCRTVVSFNWITSALELVCGLDGWCTGVLEA